MHSNDSQIIREIKNGNAQQFEYLFRLYYPTLCSYAKQFVSSHQQAEEIVQELFFQLWKNKSNIKIHTSLNAYLYRAVYLNCMDAARKQKVRSTYASLKVNAEQPFELQSQLEEDELEILIEKTLNSLSDKAQQIFKLSRFEGLKYHEIAAKLSVSIKTVESNMGKALKHFRNNLKDYLSCILV